MRRILYALVAMLGLACLAAPAMAHEFCPAPVPVCPAPVCAPVAPVRFEHREVVRTIRDVRVRRDGFRVERDRHVHFEVNRRR
jgi:hypothetical protein